MGNFLAGLIVGTLIGVGAMIAAYSSSDGADDRNEAMR